MSSLKYRKEKSLFSCLPVSVLRMEIKVKEILQYIEGSAHFSLSLSQLHPRSL
jgi:hypothetical protein